MKTKLTLNLDAIIISKAKAYSKTYKISLSELVENYLNSLTKDSTITPLVESFSGNIPEDINERETYRNFIEEKYK